MEFWVTFNDDGADGTVFADSAEQVPLRTAKCLGGRIPVTVDVLPYPAEPVLIHEQDVTKYERPPFCWSPLECKGKTACPKRYACSE